MFTEELRKIYVEALKNDEFFFCELVRYNVSRGLPTLYEQVLRTEEAVEVACSNHYAMPDFNYVYHAYPSAYGWTEANTIEEIMSKDKYIILLSSDDEFVRGAFWLYGGVREGDE